MNHQETCHKSKLPTDLPEGMVADCLCKCTCSSPSCCDIARREVIETLLLKLPAKTTTESEGILLDIYVPFNEGYNRAIQEIRALLNEQRG